MNSECSVILVNKIPVIKSGSLDTPEKVQAVLKLINEVNPYSVLRACSNQLDSTENEWDFVTQQHSVLLDTEKIVHLSTPFTVFSTQEGVRTQREEEALYWLPRLLNMEAWVNYCAWFNTLLEEAFSGFKYDAVDEYTLERYLKDYQHEVESSLLKRTVDSLIKNHREVLKSKKDYKEIVSYEKEIYLLRQELRGMVQAHLESLKEIVRIIPIIEEAHPELVAIKNVGLILEKLLCEQIDITIENSWGVTQMLLQLLNDELEVISLINETQGLFHTNLAFSIRIALLQLKKTYTKEQVIEMVLQWTNHKQDDISQAFRDLFLENLLKFCTAKPSSEKILETAELLQFIPHKARIPQLFGSNDIVELVTYDEETKAPVGLTSHGRKLINLVM